jgi:hypothetical protein
MFTPGFQVLLNIAHKSRLTYDTFYVSQDLLAQYQAVIKDAGEVKCAAREGDENSHEQVRKFYSFKFMPGLFNVTNIFLQIRQLSRSLLCQEPKVGLSGLDILNVALALSIILVLGKLAYDYWSFKTSGRIPWLVAKMP